ncbi:MAG: ribosomal RNA small subunit methyltransferase A [Candidatus Pacebacteria bacterium]|nr:ribosomal RNA small subunit methyltransferase A [Candidatus Paceibacterota bacterium]
MDLTSKKVIKNLLKKYGARSLKGLGQNFLINKAVTKKIIKEARLQSKDIVLEIGPGIGTLTQEIAKKARLVIAVEKDLKMYDILKELLECWDVKNVELVKEDILKFNPLTYKLKAKSYKVVANLPYYIVSPVIRKFLESENSPKEMLLMVQKEVAQRICAKPPDMNLLSVSVQFYAEAKIISYVSKKSFWPKPKVDGAILRITQIHTDKKTDSHKFFRIVKAGFSQPRKQLANNLTKKLELDKERIKSWLLKNNIQPTQRAETLTIKDWVNLTKSY